MNTHYQVLGIAPDATREDIKTAYRRQVKRVHPDLNQGDPRNVERMKRLVTAWEVLRDPSRREKYDRIHGIARHIAREFNYIDFLRSRTDDYESQAKLVFYDLLHDNPDEALQIYDTLAALHDFELSHCLDREDFMDCAFLLAEEYELREQLDSAFELLAAIVRFERQKPYFRHFMADVYERLRTVVCFRMPERLPPERVIERIDQAVAWDLPDKERATLFKKAAELSLLRDDRGCAVRYLRHALRLDPSLVGIKKLRHDLGFLVTL